MWAPEGASPQGPIQVLLDVQSAEGVRVPGVLQVGGEPCVQPQLVQALGDGVVFNQELERLARLADCILYLWPRSSVRLDPAPGSPQATLHQPGGPKHSVARGQVG